MRLYSIRDWARVYENNRTRELKRLAWVPIPNNHDSDGYTQLMSHKNGAALFGAWIACVQVASRCDPRGTLMRRGQIPHNSTSLSRITRIDETTIEQMLNIAESELKWLETRETQEDATSPHPSATIPQEDALKGKKERTERTEGCAAVSELTEADRIYELYPRKVGRPKAICSIRRAMKRYGFGVVFTGTEKFATAWKNEKDLTYCPYPTTWFNQDRFNDSPENWAPAKKDWTAQKVSPLTPETAEEQRNRELTEMQG